VGILLLTYVALAIILLIAGAAMQDSLTFSPAKSSACQAEPCLASSATTCCSYNLAPSRFPNATISKTEVSYTTEDGAMHG
jgi:hypothetical protein